MKHSVYLWSGLVVCAILIVILFLRVLSLEGQVRNVAGRSGGELPAIQDSIKRVQAEMKAARETAPGLGEYMTTIQLHAGKLWFAAKAANWNLAQYELDELKETMQAAKALNEEKNGVKISNVLDSVLQSQVADLDKAVKGKNPDEFQKKYDETLGACNGCHTQAGYNFIHIVRPSAPPVTNQQWQASAK